MAQKAPFPLFIMKNSLFSDTEVESLRAQVRHLRESVAELEDRLADFENGAQKDDNWSIWPYCLFVGAWNLGRDQFHCFHKKLNRWNLARRNRRDLLQNKKPLGEMRLT